MAALLEKVGFTDLREDRRTHHFVVPSEGECLDAMLNGTPMGHSIREETLEVQEQIISMTRQNLQRCRTRRGFELLCECVLVTSRK